MVEANKDITRAKKIDGFKEIIKYGLEAINLYKLQEQSEVIYKTLNALYNSLSFLYSDMYSIIGNYSDNYLLQEARTYLELLKSEEAKYYLYPEYLHTEASLELQECKFIVYSITNGLSSTYTKIDAIQKVNFSLGAIMDSINCASERKLNKSLLKYNTFFDEVHKYKVYIDNLFPKESL